MNFRFLIAQLVGKSAEWFLRSVVHRGTNKPGELILKLCPDALARYQMPPLVICVTGTNGKTSTSNLITHILRKGGKTVANNAKGSNMANGIATTLCANSTLSGRVKTEIAVLEVDERSSQYIYKYFTPTYILCTNLFRDSIQRNGHSEFIFDKINDYLPQESIMVLSANDAISGLLGEEANPRVFFEVERTEQSTQECKNAVCDLQSCPKCHYPLHFEYFHYHHIGEPSCVCGFHMPKARFVSDQVDFQNGTFRFHDRDGGHATLPFQTGNLFHVFNVTAAAAVCRLAKIPMDVIARETGSFSAKLGRFAEETIGKYKVVEMLFKNQNPISGSQCLSYLGSIPGAKDVLLLVTDSKDKLHGPEDISWLYDTDFEHLADPSVGRVIVGGTRCYDVGLRLALAGVDPAKIVLYSDYEELSRALPSQLSPQADTLAIFFELYATDVVQAVKRALGGVS